MKRDQFISLFFIVVLILITHQLFSIFSPFIQAIFWAGILAFAFYPVHEKLKKILPFSETLTSLLLTAVIFLIILPPLIILLVNMATQVIELSQWIYSYVREGKLELLIDQIRSVNWVQKIETRVFAWDPIKQNAANWLLAVTKGIGNFTASQAGVLTKNIFLIFLNLIFMFFLTFVFLKDGRNIYNFLYQIAPFEDSTKKVVSKQIDETFTAVIRGQLLTSLAQATLAGIIFWALNIPVPLFFAALTFLTSLIPIIGAAGAWVPLTIYLVILQQYGKAAILFFFGLLIISVIDNILKPAIIGEKTKLPYILLFFGILGGMKLYGFIGIFLAPVILSLFFALIKIYKEQYL